MCSDTHLVVGSHGANIEQDETPAGRFVVTILTSAVEGAQLLVREGKRNSRLVELSRLSGTITYLAEHRISLRMRDRYEAAHVGGSYQASIQPAHPPAGRECRVVGET